LELRDVWKVYLLGRVEVPAVRGVNICVGRGEYLCIQGPSGSGKSTMLNLIGCLDSPTAGTVLLVGLDTSSMSENTLARARRKMVGFVFQTFNLISGLTAKENVALPMRFDGVSKAAASKKAEELLGIVGLEGRVNHKPGELSGGERQRVAIARALINDPAIILADEPTGNLDTKSGMMVIELLESLNKRGITLIHITHNPIHAKRADRVLHLVDGMIVDDEAFNKHDNNKKRGRK
jgi:putative ABC transport system ATP-binding protein